MSARFRVHTDGRVVIHDPDAVSALPSSMADQVWRRVYPRPDVYGTGDMAAHRYTDAEVQREGWSPAVLVVLPEPVPANRKFQVGARFGSVEASVRKDGAQFIGTGIQGYRTPDEAREVAAGLLAAAAWVEQQTPVPLATGRDREI